MDIDFAMGLLISRLGVVKAYTSFDHLCRSKWRPVQAVEHGEDHLLEIRVRLR